MRCFRLRVGDLRTCLKLPFSRFAKNASWRLTIWWELEVWWWMVVSCASKRLNLATISCYGALQFIIFGFWFITFWGLVRWCRGRSGMRFERRKVFVKRKNLLIWFIWLSYELFGKKENKRVFDGVVTDLMKIRDRWFYFFGSIL